MILLKENISVLLVMATFVELILEIQEVVQVFITAKMVKVNLAPFPMIFILLQLIEMMADFIQPSAQSQDLRRVECKSILKIAKKSLVLKWVLNLFLVQLNMKNAIFL